MKNKNSKLHYNEVKIEAFYNLKRAIAHSQKVFFIDGSEEIVLQTDASDYGIGGYLYQVRWYRASNYVISKSLHNEQINWSVPEKEAYAIFYSLRKMEHLLRDVHFILKTDHKNLTFINFGSSAKILRWKLEIQLFDFDLEHIAGPDNTLGDPFSRVVKDEREVEVNELMLFESIVIPPEIYTKIEEFHNHLVGHHGINRTIDKLYKQGFMRTQEIT